MCCSCYSLDLSIPHQTVFIRKVAQGPSPFIPGRTLSPPPSPIPNPKFWLLVPHLCLLLWCSWLIGGWVCRQHHPILLRVHHYVISYGICLFLSPENFCVAQVTRSSRPPGSCSTAATSMAAFCDGDRAGRFLPLVLLCAWVSGLSCSGHCLYPPACGAVCCCWCRIPKPSHHPCGEAWGQGAWHQLPGLSSAGFHGHWSFDSRWRQGGPAGGACCSPSPPRPGPGALATGPHRQGPSPWGWVRYFPCFMASMVPHGSEDPRQSPSLVVGRPPGWPPGTQWGTVQSSW